MGAFLIRLDPAAETRKIDVVPWLTVDDPRGRPISLRLDGDALTVGRDDECDLVLRDTRVSRVHAEIRRTDDGWLLVDKGSRNGTRLGGERVEGERPLAAGSVIRIGRHSLRFELDDDAAPPVEAMSTEASLASASGVSGRSRRGADGGPELVGRSPPVRRLLAEVERLADSDETVLITGENGTGKELVARLLHRRSHRAGGPFVVVNCPALAEGVHEAELFGIGRRVATGVDARTGKLMEADGGTLLLDECGDLSLTVQSKLLRFLQERTVERVGESRPVALDVRVVAATNVELEAAIARGRFRRDLYHRLNVLAVEVPPLRERRDDVPLLVRHLLARIGYTGSATVQAVEALSRYDFPGNVRELENLLRKAAFRAAGASIETSHLDAVARTRGDDSPAVEPATAPADGGDRLAQVVSGALPWATLVQRFKDRELGRDDMRALVRAAYQRGRSYKKAASILGAEYKSFLDFIRYHRLRVTDSLLD